MNRPRLERALRAGAGGVALMGLIFTRLTPPVIELPICVGWVGRKAGMLPLMEILGHTEGAVDVRLSRTEAQALYNLLVETESHPLEAVGARPFIRQIREHVSSAIDGFPDVARPDA